MEAVVATIAEAFIAWGVNATAAYVAAYVIVAAAVITAAESQARTARNKARDASSRSQRDRALMVRSNLEARRLVFGRSRVSGPLAFVGSYGTDKEHLVMALPIAAHEVDAIETVYFNDEPVELDGSGNVLGITRTEHFTITDDEAEFTISGDYEAGTVEATAYYGSEAVPLTVAENGRDIGVLGAHASETGRCDISYRPSPNPFKPVNYTSAQQNFTSTGALQHVTLSHTPDPASVHVIQVNGTFDGVEDQTELSKVVTGTDVAFTATGSGLTIHVTYQWSGSGSSLVRVRKHLGRMDQAADSGLVAALPGIWTTNHRGAGLAYLAIEMDYDREAYSSGEPNWSAVVRGLKCYDARKNQVPNPMMDGAAVGAPGALPTGWAISYGAGLAHEVIEVGTDDKTGWPFITLRIHGTAASADAVFINPVPVAVAPAAAAGQAWSARAMVRRIDGDAWSAWVTPRLRLMSYSSGGTGTAETGTTITSAMVAGKCDPIVAADASLVSGAVKVGMHVVMSYASAQVVDQTLMVLLPQLWQGVADDAADPYAWTENLALHAINYATHPIGGRLPWAQVDMPWVDSEANVCDTEATYTVGGKDFVRPLYKGSYVAKADQQPTDVLTDLCAAMGGEWAWVDGGLRIVAGAYRAPVRVIDESWLQGDQQVQIQVGQERDALVNSITGAFIDGNQAYRAVPFAEVPPDTLDSPNPYVAEDGGKLPREVEYGAIEFDGQAQYVSACAIRAARQGMTLRLKCNLRAWEIQTFDNAVLTLDRYGFEEKVFQCRKDGFAPDGGIELVLRETGASIFDMDAGFPVTDPEPNTRLPDPWHLPRPEGLAAASGNAQLLKQLDGTIVSRVLVTWDTITDPRALEAAGRIEVDWRRFSESATSWKTVSVPGDAPGAYITPAPDREGIVIKARAIGAVGKSVDTIEILHFVQGKSAVPSTITGFTQSVIYGAIRLEWDQTTDLDYAQTELRKGGTDWASATPLLGGSEPTLVRGNKFDWAWPAFGSYTVRARNHDTSGNVGTTSATVAVVVDDTIKLGSSGIDVDLAGINLVPNSSFERDSDANGLADGWVTYIAGTTGTQGSSQQSGRLNNLCQRRTASALGSGAGDRIGVLRIVPIGVGAVQKAVWTAWVKAPTNTKGRLYVSFFDAGNSFISDIAGTATVMTTGVWARLQLPVAVPSNAADARLYAWLQENTTGSAVTFDVDDVQFEEGDASAWHPYPGEVSVRIWIQATDPGSAAKENDEWVNTSDNRVYVRAGGVWVFKRNVGAGDIDTDELADGAATDVYTYVDPSSHSVGSATTTISGLEFETFVTNQQVIATIQFSASVGDTSADSAVGQDGADNGFSNKVGLYSSGFGSLLTVSGGVGFSQTDLTPYTVRGEFIVATPGTYGIAIRANGQSGVDVTRDYSGVKITIEGIKK